MQLECDFSKICASDEKCAILSFYPFPLLFFDSTFLLFFYSSFLCTILLYGPFTLLFFDSIFLVLCSSLILPVRVTMVLLLYAILLLCDVVSIAEVSQLNFLQRLVYPKNSQRRPQASCGGVDP